MKRMAAAMIAATSLVIGAAGPRAQQPAAGLSSAEARATVDKYCVTCHNDRLKTAGLSLATVDLQNPEANAPTLERIVERLRASTMPPVGLPRPDRATYDQLREWLQTELDRSAVAHPNAGRTEGMHRLNRFEYQDVIRDLLAIEGLDIEKILPTDDASYGFDNIAGVLAISPTHVQRYLNAARKISRLAVGDVSTAPNGESQIVPLDLSQDNRLESLPFGTRGGLSIRRYFPVDGEYLIKFQTVTGFGASAKEANYVEVSVDGARAFYEKVEQKQGGLIGVGSEEDMSTAYDLRLPIKAGARTIAVTFLQTTLAEPDEMLQPYLRPPSYSTFRTSRIGGYSGPYVSQFSYAGPLNATGSGDSPSRKRIFICSPSAASEETACARRILAALARRAYRRPVSDAEVDGLLEFYTEGRSSGGFDKGIRVGLEQILSSPDFLFRIVRESSNVKPDTPYAISDLELASRLSFFLWSSIPDDELLDVAAAGRLHQPAVLDRQVRRMLKDPKASALVESFAAQWLRLRSLKTALPDTRIFPNFDENLRLAFRRETELFVESIFREDRSVLDLIGANYTFVNERLARHYGIPNVYGSQFRRVTVTDGTRGGLLGQGSILLATAQPNRTSPVSRGKWILESLLAAPPPAPPANVPSLDQTPLTGTLRQRMEQHRKNPVCASCHRIMDPLGFALENFDAVGAWRSHDNAMPVDAQGSMPDGTKFDGVTGLRQALLARPEIFTNAFVEKLMTYALGRGIEWYDAPAIRGIVRDAGKSNYQFSSIVLGIVNSVPFRMRQAEANAEAEGVAPTTTSARR
jgi:mono/diheme cytochrome c family protein